MRHNWFVRIAGILLLIGIVIAGFGWAVLQLWNALMPQIFGLPLLTFWQAVGLLALSWLLFGGWRGMPGRWHGHRHRAMQKRWASMTPEEREEFRKGMHRRWGHACGGAQPEDSSRPT
jgi:hypothetical protein